MMQFAVTVSPNGTQIIQAGKGAPRYAQCVWCGMPIELVEQRYVGFNINSTGYYYEHTSDLSTAECQKLRDSGQAELDEVLNVR